MIKYKNIIVVCLAFMLLTEGCITPKYKSPKVDTELSYRNISNDTTTIAALNWRDFYKDTKLQNLIYEALDSNFNIRIAINQIEQAKSYFKKSRAALAPSFNAGAQVNFLNPSERGTTAIPDNVSLPVVDYNMNISASWEIDIWGKIRSAKKASLANLMKQQAAKDAVVTEIVSSIAAGYYQLLMLDAQKSITEKTIQNYTDYLETVKSLKKSAQVNEVAVQQAYAQLYGALSFLPEINSSIEITENYLSMIMGKPGMNIDRSADFNIDVVASDIPVGIPAQLLQYRPDIISAEYALRASHENFNMAKASMYPALTISGSYGTESVGIDNWFSPKSLFWNAVAGLTQPIFNGRALKTQKEVAKLQNSQALLSFRQSLLLASNEVSTALLNSRSSAEKAIYQNKQYESINNAYIYSKDLLLQGYATYLDVLAAQSSLFSTEINLYTTYYNVVKQKIELYRALGGGWQ